MLTIKGALERVLDKCHTYLQNGIPAPLTLEKRTDILVQNKLFGEMALRVVAFASGKELDRLTFCGLMGLVDPPKEGVKQAIRYAKPKVCYQVTNNPTEK